MFSHNFTNIVLMVLKRFWLELCFITACHLHVQIGVSLFELHAVASLIELWFHGVQPHLVS